jgi:hypothetical protein
VRPEVVTAINEIVPHSVLMRELQSAASEVIARATGAEAVRPDAPQLES